MENMENVENIEKRQKRGGIIPGVGIYFSEMEFHPRFSNDWGVILSLGFWGWCVKNSLGE